MTFGTSFFQNTLPIKRILLAFPVMFLFIVQTQATVYTFSGTGNWTDASHWDSYPGTTINQNDQAIISSGAICTLDTWVYVEGILTNNATINVSGTFDMRLIVNGNYGTMHNNGTINVDDSGDLANEQTLNNNASGVINIYDAVFSNSFNGSSNANFHNYGTVNCYSAGAVANSGNWTSYSGSEMNNSSSTAANFQNQSPGVFEIQSGATLNNNSPGVVTQTSGTFKNYGTFNNYSGTTLHVWSVLRNESTGILNNDGFMYCHSPSGQLQNYGTVNNNADINITGSVNNQSGGTWNGTGTYSSGPFYNYGVVSPGFSPGLITINYPGNTAFDSRSGGSQTIEIAGNSGAGVPNGHDKIAISGYAYLGVVGTTTFNISFINGFTPSVGNSWQIMSWSARAWGSVAFNFPTGYTMSYVENGSGLTITVDAVPCSGTPDPGNTVSSVTPPVCTTQNFTLSLQNSQGTGTTYQWQSSPDNFSWADISGATNATYVETGIGTTTWYRCNVTCSYSGLSAYSTSLMMTVSGLCYCSAGANSSDELISNVTFNNINNSSSGFNGGYQNFTAISTDVDLGGTYTFSASISPYYGGDAIIVWIDFNQDGDFDDTGEQVLQVTSGNPSTGSITIPGTAVPGITRLRVRLHYTPSGPNYSACGNSTYGQVEDYSINIVTATAPEKYWIGGTADWNVSTNWNPNGIPVSTDEVTLNSGSPTIPSGVNAEAKFVVLNNGADLTLASGSTLTVQGGTGNGISLNNAGSVLNNSGAITINGAGLDLIGGSAGQFNNNPGGSLKGTGTVNSGIFINNGGSLMPGYSPGTLTFNGDEDFSSSIMEIEVNGVGVAGTDFDQVVVNGTATLGGTLNVTVNYTPSSGDQMTILDAVAISGTFGTENIPTGWVVNYNIPATGDITLSFGALPVELSSFVGKTMEDGNLLEWVTASEQNVAFHIVERTTPGEKEYHEVGRIPAAGNSSQEMHYHFTDDQPAPLGYYRLRSLDFDGKYELSRTIVLERTGDYLLGIAKIYPVPAGNVIDVAFTTSKEDMVNFTLTDATGKELKKWNVLANKGLNTEHINLDSLPQGLLFLTITDGLRKETQRFIKQ
ncbi:MAG: T9SS type A sorting domain-containing protein [Bacteroidetes bacterium]|nr:T9SS type A sorting domain-containing protein [Bacteroidota bacterium]